jgi:acetyltransferase
LDARRIAVVGASENNSFSVALFNNLAAFGFPQERLYPVNPRRKEVLGQKCWPGLSDVPGPIDLAALLVSRERVPEALRSCLEKTIPAAVIVASGFAERDETGKRLQREVQQLAGQGIEIIGPNCMGFVAPAEKLAAWCSGLPKNLAAGNLTAIFHSSGMLNLFFQQCADRGVGIRYGWAPGNEITVSLLDCLRAAVEDDGTRVIGLVIEHVGERREFRRLLDRARALKKPVVILRLGRSPRAARAVQAHTGRLGTPSKAWDAFVGQTGAVAVETLDHLFENCLLLSQLPPMTSPPKGKGLGIVTISGGDCSLLMDLCEDIGLDLPEPSEKSRTGISGLMGKPLSLVNPLDIEDLWSARPDAFKNAVGHFAEDAEFTIVASRLNLPKLPTPRLTEMYEGAAQAIRSAGKEPIFLTRASEQIDAQWFEFFRRLNVPFLLEYGKGLRAIKNYLEYADRLGEPTPPYPPPTPSPIITALKGSLPQNGKAALGYSETKSFLEAYGITFAPDGIARSESEAIEIATKIGFPVALKLLSQELPHKTEAGAVVLGVSTREQVSAAYRKLSAIAQAMERPEDNEGILVQSMVLDGAELLAGIFQDPLLGPAVLVGGGGIYAEILKDVSVRVPPISRAEAAAMIRELRGSAILTGARGRAECDVSALADLLVALGQIAVEFEDRLEALDLNPVMVRPKGMGVVAADALLMLKQN